mmetsp:Transcript_18213/g.43106  ORF Transcript_18213/g.43106 Transcript_18213/m.43106 type:complete len:215 (+) Transcript_18213:1327-1971(+)
MGGEVVLDDDSSMMFDLVRIGSDANYSGSGGLVITIAVGRSSGGGGRHREDAHIVVVFIVAIHIRIGSRTPWRTGHQTEARGFVLPAERDGNRHVLIISSGDRNFLVAILFAGIPARSFPILLTLHPKELLLLSLLSGPGDEPSQILTALAAHDGVSPHNRRQDLLPTAVLHQLAGAVEHGIARRHSRGIAGLREQSRHPFEVVSIGLSLPSNI